MRTNPFLRLVIMVYTGPGCANEASVAPPGSKTTPFDEAGSFNKYVILDSLHPHAPTNT